MNSLILELILKNIIGYIILLVVLIIDKNINLNKKNILFVFIVFIIKNILSISTIYHASFSYLMTIANPILNIGIIVMCSNNKIEGYISYTKYKIVGNLVSFIFTFFSSFSFTFPFARYKLFRYLSYLVIILGYYIVNRITKKEANKQNIIINTILVVISYIASEAFSNYYIGYIESFIIRISLLIIMIIFNRKKGNTNLHYRL